MIESIVIRNLCGIEQGRLGPFGRVNLFMGPNGSGKTTVLEALHLSASSWRPCMAGAVPAFTTTLPGVAKSVSLESAPDKTLPEVDAEILEGSRITYLWNSPLVRSAGGEDAQDFAVWAIQGQPARHTFFLRDEQADAPLPQMTERVLERMRAIFPRETRFEVPYLSGGERRAFAILTGADALSVATAEKPGLLLWEYPEFAVDAENLGALIGQVWDILRANGHIQAFVSTHSLEVIEAVTCRSWPQGPGLRAFRLGLKKGRLFYATFERHNLDFWLEEGLDPRKW